MIKAYDQILDLTSRMVATKKESILLALFILSHVHYAQSQNTLTECCDLKLLDATRHVVIETDRILQVGTFAAARLRLCTRDPVAIQIWTRVSPTQFQFKWQTQFTASEQQANEAYSIINLQNNPVTISAGDRLAFYNPSNASSKIPVPYDTDAINGALFYSQLRFTGSQFSSGQMINLQDLKWARTFSSYLTFCTTPNDCPTFTTPSTPASSTVSVPSGIPGMCCPPPAGGQISCDPGGAIKDNINDQNDQVKVLEDDVNRLLYILNNLINSTVVTGICPSGFISGVYGVGSCYVIHRDEKIQLAQAAIRCRDNYRAELIRIETDLEDEFLKNTILDKSKPVVTESFWTGGLYNAPLRNWYWYSDNSRNKAPYIYRNWLHGMEPTATSIYDVCSVFTVDVTSSNSYWQKNDCTTSNYYICEIPKQCL